MMLDKKSEMFISDDSRNAVPADPPAFSGEFYYSSPILDVDRAAEKQSIQGFGISFTDASCYMLSKLMPERRAGLLKELFSPEELNLSIGRLNVGPSDYATRIYSYDDTPDDVEMKDFPSPTTGNTSSPRCWKRRRSARTSSGSPRRGVPPPG